jgi:hypothetical protein
MNTLCYNCGSPISDVTREHIPAKCLYAGYSDEYKKNIVTVPACRICNENYSRIDQNLRDAIGVMNENSVEAEELTAKSVRSILRTSNWQNKLVVVNGQVKAVSFDYKDIHDFQIKNFKGLFFSEFGYPFPDDFELYVIIEGEKEEAQTVTQRELLMPILMKDENWKVSGHEKIFKYRIKSIDNEIDKSIKIEDSKLFAAVMDYHESLVCLVIAKKITTPNIAFTLAGA